MDIRKIMYANDLWPTNTDELIANILMWPFGFVQVSHNNEDPPELFVGPYYKDSENLPEKFVLYFTMHVFGCSKETFPFFFDRAFVYRQTKIRAVGATHQIIPMCLQVSVPNR